MPDPSSAPVDPSQRQTGRQDNHFPGYAPHQILLTRFRRPGASPSTRRWAIHTVALGIAVLGLASPRMQSQSSAPAMQRVPDRATPVAGATALAVPTSVPRIGASPSPAAADVLPSTPTPEPRRITEYEIRSGDSLRAIAEKFGLPTESLLWSNELPSPDLIRIGDRILIPPGPGLIHHVRAGDTVRSIAAAYRSDVHKIIQSNGLAEPFIIHTGERIFVPEGVMPRPTPAPVPVLPAPSVPDSVEAPPRDNQLAAAAVDTRPLQPGPADTQAITAPAAPLPAPASPQEAFIFSVAPAAQASQRTTGVPASVTIAQAILETYWGTSRLAREANNYFGIKAKEKHGSAGVMWIDAWEVIGGRNVVQREPFRAYASVAESFVDHGRFFLENSRYARALAARDDPRAFAREINRAGYATDPAYAGKLISLMDRFNLYRFDG